jgi:hypothetical protein
VNCQQQKVDLGFTQEIFPECHHLCLIFDTEEQRQIIVSEFLAAGLKRGELVRYFADVTPPQDVRDWLLEAGIELPKAEESGAFGIVQAESAHCPSGSFVPRKGEYGVPLRYGQEGRLSRFARLW